MPHVPYLCTYFFVLSLEYTLPVTVNKDQCYYIYTRYCCNSNHHASFIITKSKGGMVGGVR